MVVVVDHSFTAIAIFIFFLDHGLTISWPVALLNHGGAIAIAIMSFTDCHAGSNRASMHANFVREGRSGDSASQRYSNKILPLFFSRFAVAKGKAGPRQFVPGTYFTRPSGPIGSNQSTPAGAHVAPAVRLSAKPCQRKMP